SPQTSTAAPEACTAQISSRDQGHPGGAHGRRNTPIASPCHVMPCPPASPLCASWPWLHHAGCSLETMAMTGHKRHHERRYRRCNNSGYLTVTVRRATCAHSRARGVACGLRCTTRDTHVCARLHTECRESPTPHTAGVEGIHAWGLVESEARPVAKD